MNLLSKNSPLDDFRAEGGGKALNLARLARLNVPVPEWFCVSAASFDAFLKTNDLTKRLRPHGDLAIFATDVERMFLEAAIPADIETEILRQVSALGLDSRFVAVRSSGLDEDSAQNSFAGQFSSYLFQRGREAILASLKRCWASAFSERALSYRLERGLPLEGIRMGVVIQAMVNSEISGVAFSRNPTRPLDRDSLVVSAVYGLGEGLVSGELPADEFTVNRTDFQSKATLETKEHALRQAPEGGLRREAVAADKQRVSSLSDAQLREVAKLAMDLETRLGAPQDCEWGFEAGHLYCLQTRPVTTLPPEAFYDNRINGGSAILWDNSNIIESYSGVTSPLTFTFASNAYRQVYVQFCQVMGVPDRLVLEHESMFRNMLGLIRGRVYYHLINWYRLILLLPGAGSNKGFMETMMGVQQGLKPELANLFDFIKHPPKYSAWKRIEVTVMTVWRFIRIDSIIADFNAHFLREYNAARRIDFKTMPLPAQVAYYQKLDEEILRRWKAPIINDYLCMVFFGLLKKLTAKWVQEGDAGASLQNDLLCGQGDIESTEPTKTLMRIAEKIDRGDSATREWLLGQDATDAWREMSERGRAPELLAMLRDFLDRYGFRCMNELKLEEPDLHDDPSFAVQAVQSYVRMKTYDISEMERREHEILVKAETTARAKLNFLRRPLYFWVLKQARRAVKNRENLRFARTKIFGVVRHLFRGVGANLVKLGRLNEAQDIFSLTLDEIIAYVEGRIPSLDLRALASARKAEFEHFRRTPPPPDRLLTYGAVGLSEAYPMVLADADLLRAEAKVSDDPNLLYGTPCCPGVVEGVVKVVHSPADAKGLNGEILVTERTDPGWVPLYPSCSGLLIERGSLLSHSAVVARELGLPTIVGVTGGLMRRLKTGQRVRIDAGRGEIRILS